MFCSKEFFLFTCNYLIFDLLLGRVLQRHRTSRIYIHTQKERLPEMIMEAEKFHDLSSARWRPREASGLVLRAVESMM